MNSKAQRPLVIFLIIGALLLIVSFLIRDTTVSLKIFLSNSLSSVGFILLTVVVLNWLWGLLGGEPIATTLNEFRSSVRLLNDSHLSGIQRLVPISGDFGSHKVWMERLKSAQDSVDLLGYTLHVWTRGHNFEEEVVELVRRGVCFKVMIMDENNSNLSCLVNDLQIPSISLDQVKDEIRIVKRVYQGILEKIETLHQKSGIGTLEFRTIRRGIALYQICRTDNEMTVVAYQYSAVASHSPLLHIRGIDSKLFESFTHEFNSLWNLNGDA